MVLKKYAERGIQPFPMEIDMAHKVFGVKGISAGLFSRILKFNVSLGCFRAFNKPVKRLMVYNCRFMV